MNAEGVMEFSGIVGGRRVGSSGKPPAREVPAVSALRDRILDVGRVPGGPVRSTFPKRTRVGPSEGDLADVDL